MAQIFHHSTNVISRASIFGALFIIVALAFVLTAINRSPYATQANVVRQQPVQFSHKHHATAMGIDCRYCHTTVEESRFAGIPPTETCMTCHSQIWIDSPMLEPVRASFRNNTSIPWVRVHDLPEFVYFDHSIHVKKGVGCATCHGRVDLMPLTWREHTLHMEWCLQCHREPERFLRPRDQVFNMAYTPPADQLALGRKLMQEYKVQRLTDCYTCHR